MSLDYWRNKEDSCYLSFIKDGLYMFRLTDKIGYVTLEDLQNLYKSLDYILATEAEERGG
jgi:hypothetical protein